MKVSTLKLDNVTKSYSNHLAVDGVSFEVPQGSVFGLLGPNGAGKTSIIRMITTITAPDSGTIYLNGEALGSRHPQQIGYLPEERGLYKKMKVGEQLMYLAQLKGMSKADAKISLKNWMERFECVDWWDKKIEELSKGMQQKIQFIATVVHNPDLIILDEPFTGLDPLNTNLIKDEIHNLNLNGTTVIFSTHRMEQVEEICRDIVLINQGQNVLEGTVESVKNQFKKNRYRIEFDGTLPQDLNNGEFQIIEDSDHELIMQLGENGNPNNLLKSLLGRGIKINSFNELLPSLNEIFITQVNALSNE